MIPQSRSTYDDDLFPGRGSGADRPPSPNPLQIYRGVMGWKDDNDHASIDNGGLSLLKVTLYQGKHVTSGDPVEGQAHGFQVLARTMGPFHWAPRAGTPVIVAFPDGDIEAPGAAVILGDLSSSPAVQFSKDRAVFDLGDQHVIFKAKSVTLSDQASPARFIQVGVPPQGGTAGISACDDKGGGFTIQGGVVGIFSSDGSGSAKNLIQMTGDSFEIWATDSGFIKISSKVCTIFSPTLKLQGAGVYLGKTPTASNTAQWGPTGTGSSASLSVFISPT